MEDLCVDFNFSLLNNEDIKEKYKDKKHKKVDLDDINDDFHRLIENKKTSNTSCLD